MKRLKNKENIDFCEDCGRDVKPQRIDVIECDCGFKHYPCRDCIKKKKYKK